MTHTHTTPAVVRRVSARAQTQRSALSTRARRRVLAVRPTHTQVRPITQPNVSEQKLTMQCSGAYPTTHTPAIVSTSASVSHCARRAAHSPTHCATCQQCRPCLQCHRCRWQRQRCQHSAVHATASILRAHAHTHGDTQRTKLTLYSCYTRKHTSAYTARNVLCQQYTSHSRFVRPMAPTTSEAANRRNARREPTRCSV
jgi:hypothetical protein